jgi:hypothetical protein
MKMIFDSLFIYLFIYLLVGVEFQAFLDLDVSLF